MEKLLLFLRGYVKIRVSGYSPQRFMNLCCNHNILLWNIENHGTYYSMFISIAGFFNLKSIRRKTKTKVVIEEKHGLPFLLFKIKKRAVFLIGFLGCLFFLYMMSYFVWQIEITGNHILTEDVLMDFLEEQEIVCGSRKAMINISELESEIRESFPLVTWVSGKIEGSKLCIQIKENDRNPVSPEKNKEEYKDFIAEQSGKIVHMITRSGVPCVKIDDEVKKGDTLVSGIVPIYNDAGEWIDSIYCKADADIFLQYEYTFQDILPETYEQKIYTGEELIIPYIRMGKKEYRLRYAEHVFQKCDCIINENKIQPLKDYYLPISYGSFCYREYYMVQKKYSETEVKRICSEKVNHIIESLAKKGVQIIQKNVKIKKNSRQYLLQVNFTLIEKIDNKL